ncbi:MAG TPA: DMT family transporter [Spirochaetales bacterium]|nr:DMT family transporter [Spirochaetales bacterium]HRY55105.1 DMT family transporter [Spirochaetia bacterium]HRZ64646.1 DMT family transporter [Spirochaetia bacterium]
MYAALAPLVGALITLMNGLNSRFAARVGYLAAALVIHLAGLAAVQLILLARREGRGGREGRERLPPYYYLGGFVGVGTVFASSYAFARLGATLAVALALLGQALFSLGADATGLLGRKRYPLSARRLPGIALALAGVALMAGQWRANIPALLAGLAAGLCPGLSFILNSELGRRVGVFRSTRVNYLAGLATILAVALALRLPLAASAQAVAEAGPFLALGGGFMGVAVVSSMNFIFPRLSAFSATLLVFGGQALTGLALDGLAGGMLDTRKLAGTALLLAGFAADAALSRRPGSPQP